jgi:hypothetical protein
MNDHDQTRPLPTAEETAAGASAEATLPQGPTAVERPARVGTIVWGFLLIGLAAVFFVTAQFDLGRFNPAVIAVWAVLGIGVLTVIGGLAGALLRRR